MKKHLITLNTVWMAMTACFLLYVLIYGPIVFTASDSRMGEMIERSHDLEGLRTIATSFATRIKFADSAAISFTRLLVAYVSLTFLVCTANLVLLRRIMKAESDRG